MVYSARERVETAWGNGGVGAELSGDECDEQDSEIEFDGAEREGVCEERVEKCREDGGSAGVGVDKYAVLDACDYAVGIEWYSGDQ